MLKLPRHSFKRQRLVIQTPGIDEKRRHAARVEIVNELVQAEIESRLMQGGNDPIGFATVSPAGTIGSVGGGSGGYNVLEYEVERLLQRTPEMDCARELLNTLHERQRVALLLASYSTHSPRNSGDRRVGGRNSRALTLSAVVSLQYEIARELGLGIAVPFATSKSLKECSRRAVGKLEGSIEKLL
ncbi:hypothetical protein [Carnimonas bestiolae]|uniref:hypothetical protein n=1 Tax=Carnimonas bestiolae TaxID=3402172 RepID=UPI003EDC29F9